MIFYFLSLIFIILAGFSNSIMDTIRFRFDRTIFSKIKNPKWMDWVDPKLSWDNKWKTKKAIEEKFPGSSTYLVFITDLWHFAQALMILFFILSGISLIPFALSSCTLLTFILKYPILSIITHILLCFFAFGGTFELFWNKIWIKKK